MGKVIGEVRLMDLLGKCSSRVIEHNSCRFGLISQFMRPGRHCWNAKANDLMTIDQSIDLGLQQSVLPVYIKSLLHFCPKFPPNLFRSHDERCGQEKIRPQGRVVYPPTKIINLRGLRNAIKCA